MAVKREHAEALDAVAQKALAWADQMLSMEVAATDLNFLKINALKAEAARLVGQLKARVDPAGMRGAEKDEIGGILDEIKAAREKTT